MTDSNDKKNVLIIDDKPSDVLFLTELLEEDFNLTHYEDGNEALENIETEQPDIILLDYILPNISGLDVCKQLKNNSELSHIPIIFLSALNQVKDRKAGYVAGGDDYVAKPFSALEVLTKIKTILNNKQALEEQTQQTTNNMQMAMTLMAQNGETGHVLHFLKDSFLTKSVKELCSLIMDTCENYDLKVAVRANTNPPQIFSQEDEIKQIDQQILDMLYTRERLIYFENRCLVNFEHISLLIKNMPVNDDEKNGRLKDHIALIMEGADARMVSLENELKLSERELGLLKMLDSTKLVLNEIEDNFNLNAEKNNEIMSALGKKIEWNFVQLGLTQEQEDELSDIVEDAIIDSSSLYQEGLNIDGKITQLTNELKNIINK